MVARNQPKVVLCCGWRGEASPSVPKVGLLSKKNGYGILLILSETYLTLSCVSALISVSQLYWLIVNLKLLFQNKQGWLNW